MIKHFVIDIENNINKDVPLKFNYEGQDGFVCIDYEGNCVFVNSKGVKNVEHLFDNATINIDEPVDPPTDDKCNINLIFGQYVITNNNTNNQLEAIVINNSNYIVQFKTELTEWLDATFNSNKIIIDLPASGKNEKVLYRLKGCDTIFEKLIFSPIIEKDEFEENVVGTVNFGTDKLFVLVIVKLNNKFWFLQTDTNRTFYIIRGSNFLSDSRVVLTKTVDINTLSNKNSGIGGLEPIYPSDWDDSYFLSKGYIFKNNEYTKEVDCVDTLWTKTNNTKCVNNKIQEEFISNCGTIEYRNTTQNCNCVDSTWTKTEQFNCVNGKKQYIEKSNCGNTRLQPVSNETCQVTANGILPYTPTLTPNRTNWNQFPDVVLPEKFIRVGGYGFPLYNDEEIDSNGKLILFKKGFTNLTNLSALHSSKWQPKNLYTFTALYNLLREAARIIYNINNGNIPSQFGDIASVADLSNTEEPKTNVQYQNVTIAGAIELGKFVFAVRSAVGSIDHPNSWPHSTADSVMMIDEEVMTPNNWIGGDFNSFLGYINKGIKLAAPNLKVFWYGRKFMSYAPLRLDSSITIQNVQNELNTLSNFNFNSAGWKESSWYNDIPLNGYNRVPFIPKDIEIYEKEGNLYKIVNGKRVYRKDNFTITHFNQTITIYGEPHDMIKYQISNGTNILYGLSYVNINPDKTASIKQEYVNQGYKWYQDGRQHPSSWQPETEMFIEGMYRRISSTLFSLLKLQQLEFNNFDISRYIKDRKYKAYIEARLRTENWTFGGNHIYIREIGEDLIYFDIFATLLSGFDAVSTWDDGRDLNNLPNKGNPLYNQNNTGQNNCPREDHISCDDINARYECATSGYLTVTKFFEGKDLTKLRYVHFFYPYIGWYNYEPIFGGVYIDGKLQLWGCDVNLGANEQSTITLKIKDVTINIVLDGRGIFNNTYDIPTNVEPSDFIMTYKNIYGTTFTVNGVINNNINSHYL